jgi:hypothetical protein
MRPLIIPPRQEFIFQNVKNYFLDYLTINIHIPENKAVKFELDDKRMMLNDMMDALANPKKIIPEWVRDCLTNEKFENKNSPSPSSYLHANRKKYDHYYGLNIKRMTRHNFLKIDFSGRFWSGSVNQKFIYEKYDKIGNPIERTKKLVKYDGTGLSEPTRYLTQDIDLVAKTFYEIEDICNTILNNYWGDGRKVYNTISRIDISTQKKSDLNKSIFKSRNHPWFQVKSPQETHAFPYIDLNTGKYVSFLIAKPNENNMPDLTKRIWLKVYDKNQTINQLNKAICLSRFGTTNVIRKEWHLRRPFFKSLLEQHGNNGKADFEALHYGIRHNDKTPLLYNLFRRIRMNMDCILYNDTHKYIAFHDPEARKQLKLIHKLPLWKINGLFKRISPPQLGNLDLTHILPTKNMQKAKHWSEITILTKEIKSYYKTMDTKDKMVFNKFLFDFIKQNKIAI